VNKWRQIIVNQLGLVEATCWLHKVRLFKKSLKFGIPQWRCPRWQLQVSTPNFNKWQSIPQFLPNISMWFVICMLLSSVTELFIQWGGEYHFSLDYQITLYVGSFFSISSQKKGFLFGKNPFLPMGREEIPFYKEKTQPWICSSIAFWICLSFNKDTHHVYSIYIYIFKKIISI